MPRQMSKTLLPMALLTAMLPMPSRATTMEPSASGTDVPAASTVRPMTTGSRPMAQPMRVAWSTSSHDSAPISRMLIENVTMYHLPFSNRSSPQSGMVCEKNHCQGAASMLYTLFRKLSSSSPPLPSSLATLPACPCASRSATWMSCSARRGDRLWRRSNFLKPDATVSPAWPAAPRPARRSATARASSSAPAASSSAAARICARCRSATASARRGNVTQDSTTAWPAARKRSSALERRLTGSVSHAAAHSSRRWFSSRARRGISCVATTTTWNHTRRRWRARSLRARMRMASSASCSASRSAASSMARSAASARATSLDASMPALTPTQCMICRFLVMKAT
mmetsp:Transcript_585/g.1699  ORF Transcript_585/g.1699 Transcript_585/m.1699 type:complete len:342 (-) Transcript_585:32-1057(-)